MSQWGKEFAGEVTISGTTYFWRAVPHYDSEPFTPAIPGADPGDIGIIDIVPLPAYEIMDQVFAAIRAAKHAPTA